MSADIWGVNHKLPRVWEPGSNVWRLRSSVCRVVIVHVAYIISGLGSFLDTLAAIGMLHDGGSRDIFGCISTFEQGIPRGFCAREMDAF